MECTPEFGPYQSEQSYTDKQRKLIEQLSSVILQEGINLDINPYCHSLGLSNPISVDVEHDEQGNLVGIGISQGKWCGYFTHIDYVLKEQLEKSQLIMHNGVSDIECLQMWGINVQYSHLYWDTMLVGHILDSSTKDYSLKGMANKELGIIYPSYEDIVGKRGLKTERITLDKQPIELVSRYNALDTYVTYKLYERQKKAMGI